MPRSSDGHRIGQDLMKRGKACAGLRSTGLAGQTRTATWIPRHARRLAGVASQGGPWNHPRRMRTRILLPVSGSGWGRHLRLPDSNLLTTLPSTSRSASLCVQRFELRQRTPNLQPAVQTFGNRKPALRQNCSQQPHVGRLQGFPNVLDGDATRAMRFQHQHEPVRQVA